MIPKGRTAIRPSGMKVTQEDKPPQHPIRLDCRLEELQCWLEFQPEGGDWNNITNQQADCWRIRYHNSRTSFAGSTLEEALSTTERTLAGVLMDRRHQQEKNTENQARMDHSLQEARQQVENLFQNPSPPTGSLPLGAQEK